MGRFVFTLVLVINAVLAKPQWGVLNRVLGGAGQLSGGLSASGSVGIGGCSIGASGNGNAGLSGGGASGSASVNCARPEAGYTYSINATRTLNIMGDGDPVAYMYYEPSPKQNITYNRSLGPNYPLMIEGHIFISTTFNTLYFSNDMDDLLNSCATYEKNTWAYVLTEVVKKSIIPNGGCSVEKGVYTIYEHVEPVSVTFPEMIRCGKYDMYMNGYVAATEEDLSKDPNSEWTWAFLIYYEFEIPDDGNCIEDTPGTTEEPDSS